MNTCIVLGDKAVHDILINLSKDDIVKFRDKLGSALLDFSVHGERAYQPEPAVVTRPNGQKTLFRSFTSQHGPGVKIIVDPSTPSSAAAEAGHSGTQPESTNGKTQKPTLHGILALCDKDGLPMGFVNAEEITAYRTSLGVMIPYSWRTVTTNIVVFGAGKQALWHLRLALALRGAEIKRITVVNRSVERARAMLSQIQQENQRRWKSPAEFDLLDAGASDYEKRLEDCLAQADVVFCTTPASQPLFPAHYLTGRGPERRGCFISAIGSWQADMLELDPVLLTEAAKLSSQQDSRGGDAVIADDRAGALKDAGEIVQSNLDAGQILELGELLNLRDSSPTESSEKEKLTKQHLEDGLVVYKSIGVSIMDLAAGHALLSLAREQGKGISVPDF